MKGRVNFVSELWDLCSFFRLTESMEKTQRNAGRKIRCSIGERQLRAREPFDVEGTENECKAWIESKGYHLGIS